MTTKLASTDYYDGSRLLSYGCPITIACGIRSAGKTYFFKRRALRRARDTGARFIYLRRYDEQVKSICRKGDSFLSDLIDNRELPGYDMRVHGRAIEIRQQKKDAPWQVAGYIMALSSYESEKSNIDSSIDTIIFDEFIKERKRVPYLENEVSALMNLWETYDREENRIKIHMLGNAVDMNNPYFLEWDIRITPETPRFSRWHDNAIALEYFDKVSDAFAERQKSSNIYKVSKGTSYSMQSHRNRFNNMEENFIAPKTSQSIHTATITYFGYTIGVWLDFSGGIYYLTEGAPADGKPVYTLTRDDMRPNVVMLTRASGIIKTLGRMFRQGYIYMDKIKTREMFMDMLHRNGQL